MKGYPWDAQQLEVLINCYADTPTEQIAALLKVSIHRVYGKANKLGLRKSQEYLNSEQSGRLTCTRRSSSTQFKPGQAPWNKGMKGVDFGGKATQFKPGHMPANTKHDNFISIRNDSSGRQYKHVRVSLGEWELLQRKIWRDAHGPIPSGMVIVFKDGDTMNCNLDNLMMITMAENMLRNTIQRYPEELIKTIKSVSKLKRTLKKIRSHE